MQTTEHAIYIHGNSVNDDLRKKLLRNLSPRHRQKRINSKTQREKTFQTKYSLIIDIL